MSIDVHLDFADTCEEAFRFYAEVLGGTDLQIMTNGASPMADKIPAERKNLVMHAHLNVDGTALMGADAPPQMYRAPQGVSLSVGAKDAAEAERKFAALSEGGQVRMPMAETFFRKRCGMVTERFGIPWMVVCQAG